MSGAAAYRVFRDGARIARVSTPAYLDTSLTGSGSHDYTVRAVSSTGAASAFSAPATVLVDRTAPSCPGTPSTSGAVLAGPPSLSWAAASDALSGVASYQVVRDGDVVATVGGTVYTDSAVADGSHVYTVRAIDAAGNTSAPSGGASVTIDTTPPAFPATPAAPSPTRSAPSLTWSPTTDAGTGSSPTRLPARGR